MYLYPLFRISGFFIVAPIFGSQLVTPRVRLGLAVLVTVLLAPMLPPPPLIDPLSPAAAVLIAQQLLIGIAMGFAMLVFFQVFVVGAQIMAMQMSLGFASMVDPSNGVNVTILGQYFVVLLTLVFVASNGHLVMFEVFVESFRYMPVGGSALSGEQVWTLASLASWLFVSGLLLALPAVTALLVVNLAFGVMTRAAPQLNIFSLGFPVSMVFGLFIVWVSMAGFMPSYARLSREAFELLRLMAGAP